MAIMGELARAGLHRHAVPPRRLRRQPRRSDRGERHSGQATSAAEAIDNYKSAPGGGQRRTSSSARRTTMYPELDLDRENGCIRDVAHCLQQGRRAGGALRQYRAEGLHRQDRRRRRIDVRFQRPGKGVFVRRKKRREGILGGTVKAGDVVVIRYEGPKGGPGMQEMLYPTSYLRSMHLEQQCALITDGRFSGGIVGAFDRPCIARSRGGRGNRPAQERRHHRNRHTQKDDQRKID